jgi:cytoskeletal protein CcmA (bactofilin family)
MFSSKSKVAAPTVPPAPVQAQAAHKKVVRAASAPSVISADLVVNGTLTSIGDIQIEGRVEGDVRSSGLLIGDNAVVQGDVYAEDITVRGRIEGGIRARKVLLCSTCHVEGNILHEAFAVETGAFFEGNCRHSDDPLAEEPPPRRAPAEYANHPAAASSPAPSNAPAPTMAGGAAAIATVARPLNDGNGAASRPAPTVPKT